MASSENKCEKCGQEFDSKRGLHIHQSQVHDNSDIEEESSERLIETGDGLFLPTKQFGGLTFALGLLLGFILGGVFLSGGLSFQSGEDIVSLESGEYPYGELEAGIGSGEKQADNVTFKLEGEPYIGSPEASITAVSYEDFQCPFCKEYNQNAYLDIVENHVRSGEVQYFYKNFPIPAIGHNWAEPSALASECALNQDPEAFWTFKKGFFDNQERLTEVHESDPEKFDESMYKWARQTGLDVGKFKQCYDNEEEMDEVDQDKAEAADVNASATPTIFIGSHKIAGAYPYSNFKEAINQQLDK
ncbi:MAG: protein-disulfide isomerase [Candidatus Nanohaloarchaea archaeon]|jgi:protein-disulfide isomerase